MSSTLATPVPSGASTLAPRPGSLRVRRLGLFGVLVLAVPIYWVGREAPAADGALGRSFTPTERMSLARLRDTHEGVARLKAQRQDVPPLPGLTDVRAIFHAHAEDSAHTGGTRAEMLADAKRAGVGLIFLSNHYRPPRDFMTDSWRGLRDGVLFVPGSEVRGFLIHPMNSVMAHMDDPPPEFLNAVRAGGGLAFLSHVEERPDYPMDGLDGLEIYNRHADAKKDLAGMLGLVLKLTDPKSLAELREGLERYPDELLGSQLSYPGDYLAKWDRETPRRRLTGVAANDCHHNTVFVVKVVDADTVLVGTNVDRDDQMRSVSARLRPGIRELTRGRTPGEVVARLDLDPYHRAFLDVSTHLLVPSFDEAAARDALRAGHAYVSHDWMADPTGFRFTLEGGAAPGGTGRALLGDEVARAEGARFALRSPVPCRFRLLSGGRVVAEGRGTSWEHPAVPPGVYRAEAWVELGGEERPWVYTNPIYVR